MIRSAAVLFLLVGLSATGNAEDSASISDWLATFSERFSATLRENGEGTVSIGDISGPPGRKDAVGSSSAGLQMKLKEALKRKASVVPRDGRYSLTGEWALFKKPRKVVISLKVQDTDSGQTLLADELTATRPGDVSELLQVTAELNPKLSDSEQMYNVIEASARPGVHVTESEVRPNRNSDYGLRVFVAGHIPDRNRAILDLSRYRVAKTINKDQSGLAFAEIRKGQVYAIELINDSLDEHLASVTIDGVNCFAFSDTGSQYWIVSAKSRVTVVGWHISASTTEEFLVTDDQDSKLSELAAKETILPSAEVGVINVQFFESSKDRGTGGGNQVIVDTIQEPRTLGRLKSSIALRYER